MISRMVVSARIACNRMGNVALSFIGKGGLEESTVSRISPEGWEAISDAACRAFR